jgi:hypothetical protein
MLNPLQGTDLQYCILYKEPIYNAEPFARNLSANCILCKKPIFSYNAEPFARNLSATLHSLQGTYICNTICFARNLFTTLNRLQGTYLQHCILCKEPNYNAASFARNLPATMNHFARNQVASLTPLTRNLSAKLTQIELKQLTRAGKHDCLET